MGFQVLIQQNEGTAIRLGAKPDTPNRKRSFLKKAARAEYLYGRRGVDAAGVQPP